VLEAKVRLQSKASDRLVSVSELFTDYYETQIQPGELLTEVIVPVQPANAKTAYLKFLPRTEDDYATVAVAALTEMDGGVCRRAKVALIAAGPTSVHATAVEHELEGRTISPEVIRNAAAAVEPLVDPLDDFRGSSEYKRDMAIVFTRRALERVLS
jgi:carbon-monoxide dehydrogenase medium subunit